MVWFSSWLPGLPNLNFAIPTSIQGRFISFVLKKSLGHLLKPGQLDYHQIDSQIGSGYVQVNDLELSPEVRTLTASFSIRLLIFTGHQRISRWPTFGLARRNHLLREGSHSLAESFGLNARVLTQIPAPRLSRHSDPKSRQSAPS